MATKNRIHVVPVADDVDMQTLVYGLVRDTVMRMLGPAGSFAVAVRSENTDPIFAEMVAESLAWQVSVSLESSDRPSARITA